MRAFVTGATGFIGKRLVAALLREGAEVDALVRGDHTRLPRGVRPVAGDIMAPDLAMASSGGYDALFHLAGFVSFKAEMRAELRRVHEEGTRNVLNAARAWGGGTVVVASSACTIGLSSHPGTVLDETSPADPNLARRNPYLDSKLGLERVCAEAAAAGQHVVVVNPTTIYGPGDASLNSGTLIKAVVTSAMVPVPAGGSNVADVDEVVAGFIAAARKGRSGERYILGGRNLRFAEIVKTVARAAGRRPALLPLPGLLAGPMAVAAWGLGLAGGGRFLTPQIVGDLFGFKYYSSAKAQRELGWLASRPFEETVTDALAYYREEGLIP
ncbi:MAG: NAD-dependent epimerase/dehydratase family protein [Humidesulfovibrio sp.]|nr:NAD-dependent epimerase/dehydratase family protein [Humidesulfovibrio sp.]